MTNLTDAQMAHVAASTYCVINSTGAQADYGGAPPHNVDRRAMCVIVLDDGTSAVRHAIAASTSISDMAKARQEAKEAAMRKAARMLGVL